VVGGIVVRFGAGGRVLAQREDVRDGDDVASPEDAAMDRYANGDDDAFGEIYEAVAPRILTYLRRQTSDQAHAEDVLQQTLLQIHRARASFVPGARLMPWAFAIARRLLVDSARKKKRQVPLARDEEVEASPPSSRSALADEVLHARELAEVIERELARMPETQRVAFELIRQDGLSVAEAAEVLGTTTTAVKLRAHRAYDALRAALGNVLDGEWSP